MPVVQTLFFRSNNAVETYFSSIWVDFISAVATKNDSLYFGRHLGLPIFLFPGKTLGTSSYWFTLPIRYSNRIFLTKPYTLHLYMLSGDIRTSVYFMTHLQ